MSLHALANNMAAQGRGPDSTLVHMSPQEVDGLQALAMRHGGSLTINPQTGLPEAGFLSSILPLIAGIGLTAMGMPAGMAALTVGGGTALVTGDLKKGLMAGLGAYGGAGLAESLIGSGAAGLAPEVATASLNAVPTETAAQIASSAAPQAANIASEYTRISPPDMFASGPPSTYQSAIQAAGPIPAAEAVKVAAPQTVTPQPEMYTKGAYLPNSAATMSPANMTAGQRFDALKAGATGQNLLNYAKANPLQTAGMLAGPLMASEDNNAPFTSIGDADRGAMANAGYQFDPGWSNPIPAADPYGREQRYNQPRYYIPKKAADGGAVQHFDVGGTVNGFNQTPALNKFAELQAARGATPAPATIDAKQQFADYLRAQSGPVSTATPYHPVVESHLPVSSDDTGIAAINRTNLVDDGDNGIVKLLDRGRGAESAAFTQRPGVNTSDTGGQDFGITNQPPGAVFNINDFDAVNEFGIGSQPVDTTFNINDFDNNTSAGTVDNSVNDFGVGNQPEGATFDIDDFKNTSAGTVDNSVNDFGIGNQPAGTTFDINDFNSDNGFSETGGQFGIVGQPEGATFNINDFDNNTSAGVGDYGGKDFGVTGQPDGATFDINNFDNNTSAGTVNTGDSGSYTGDAGDGMDNVDTSNPEIFSQEYVDPRTDPFEEARRLEQSEMNEGYFGGFNSGNDSGNNFGSGYGEPGSDYGNGYSDSGSNYGGYSDYGNDYGGGYSDYGIGGGGGGDYGYDMSYRAKGGPIKSNFKNARNINAYRSGLANYAGGGIAALAQGGMYNLGSYSDGGRLLRGPGDGVSDSIPAVIGRKQPARLADGEFVIPARIVSEIGNGSTEAGARKLYAMMDKVQSARRATVGKGRVAKNTRADRYLPA